MVVRAVAPAGWAEVDRSCRMLRVLAFDSVRFVAVGMVVAVVAVWRENNHQVAGGNR